MKAPLIATDFIQALQDACIIDPDVRVQRVVIDARRNWVVTMHIEQAGDRGLLQVVPSLEGVKIQREHRPPVPGAVKYTGLDVIEAAFREAVDKELEPGDFAATLAEQLHAHGYEIGDKETP